MELVTIELQKLIASEGKVLTNGFAYNEEVYLSENDSIDNWHEITKEEYEAIKLAEEEASK